MVAAACTGSPSPPVPTPTPTVTDEPAPSGVAVAVVLPPADDPASSTFVDVEERLDDLASSRIGDVAGVRAVAVDDADFLPDTAALLADAGTDLVCVLGTDGVRTVLDLADRYPASRFCALGDLRDELPANVDVFEVAHEELGHALGTAAAGLTAGAPVGIVIGDDDAERTRRRSGARAALATSSVVIDAAVDGAESAADLVAAANDADESLAVVLLDTASTSIAAATAGSARWWIGPAGLTADDPAALRWGLRADVVVGAAVDRLVLPDEPDLPTRLGFAQELFSIRYDDQVPDEVRDAVRVVADELARGVRDPLAAVTDVPDGSSP